MLLSSSFVAATLLSAMPLGYGFPSIIIELLDGFSNVLKIRVEEEPVTQHHFSKLLDVQLTTTINWK